MTWISIIVITISLASAFLAWRAIEDNRKVTALVDRYFAAMEEPVMLKAGDKVDAAGQVWQITEIEAKGSKQAVIRLRPPVMMRPVLPIPPPIEDHLP